jgi:hypothetical protein
MLRGGFLDLSGRGKVDETVGEVDWRAEKPTGAFGLAPKRFRRYLVDEA